MDSIKILIIIVAHIIEGILGFLFFYLILFYFDIETVGYYGVLISFLETFTFILELGFTVAYLKIYPEINESDKPVCNGTFLFIRLIQFMVYALSIFALALFLPLDHFDLTVLYFFIGSYILGFFGTHTVIIILIRKKQIFKRTILVISFALMKIVLLIILRSYYVSDLWLIAMVYFISNLTFFTINFLFFKGVKIKMPTKEYLKKFLEYVYPLFLITTLQIILINIDVLLVNLYVPIDDVAVYYTSKKIYGYFYVIISAIGYILLTTFSKNISMQNEEENLRIITQTHKFLNLLFIPLIFIFILYSAEFIVLIFGPNYEKIGIILYILLFNVMLFLNYCAIETQLWALGKVMILAKISLLRTILTILLMIIFISPEYINLGIIGAAFAIVFAEILTQLIIRPIIYKKYGIGYYWGSFRNLAIMLLVFLLQLYINSQFSYNMYFIPLFILFNLSLYFLINYLFKGFSKEDIKFFFNIVNLRNIKESILSEIRDNTI